MLKRYLKEIFNTGKRGDAREESYYEDLKALLEELATSFGKTKVHITTLPKSTEAGNPDFRVWDGIQHIVGYVEAKAPTIENLDIIKSSKQLKRYRHTFPNLILPNCGACGIKSMNGLNLMIWKTPLVMKSTLNPSSTYLFPGMKSY